MKLTPGKRYYTTIHNKQTVLFHSYHKEEGLLNVLYRGNLILLGVNQITKAK